MRNKAIALSLALSLLCCAAALGEEAPALVAPADAAVSKAAVTRGSIAKMQPFQATVVPEVHALAFSAAGTVGTVHVIPGQAVHTGDLLAELNVEDAQESIDTLREEIAYAEQLFACQSRVREIDIQLRTMDRDALTDVKELALLDNDLALLRTQADEAYDTYQLEQQTRRVTLEKLMEKTRGVSIVAPCDGVVTGLRLAPGTDVLAKEKVVFLADDTQLYIQCDFQKKDKMDVAVAVYALVDGVAYPCTYIPMDDREYVAQTLLGGAMFSRFALDMATLPQSVHAGLSAALCVVTQQKDDVLVVPSSAVFRTGADRFVYVVGADQSMSLRTVTIGVSTDLSTEIVSGLEEGEQVYVKE